jgi:hypothetical protein
MLLFNEFKFALKEINKNKVDYLFLFLHLIVLADLIVALRDDINMVVIFLFSIFMVISKKRFHISKYIIFVLLFVVLSIPSIIFIGLDIKLYIGFLLRISTAFMIVMYFRNDLFKYLENTIFVVAYLSIFFFIIQFTFPIFFDIFTPLSRILNPEHTAAGNRYLILYWYIKDLFRNPGIFWEPAVYGAFLAWAMLFNLFFNNFNLNKRLLVLFIAGITTFSVGFMFYLGLILLLYTVKKNIRGVAYFAVLIIAGFVIAQTNDFVKEKIEIMTTKIEDEEQHIDNAREKSVDSKSISRVGGWVVNAEYFAKWPFGYGVQPQIGEYEYLASSPNGFVALGINLGIFGILIIILSTYKTSVYLNKYYSNKPKLLAILFTMLIIIGPYNGNPFNKQPITFALLLIGFYLYKPVFDKKQVSFARAEKLKRKGINSVPTEITIN